MYASKSTRFRGENTAFISFHFRLCTSASMVLNRTGSTWWNGIVIISYMIALGEGELIFVKRPLREPILTSIYLSKGSWVGDRDVIWGDSNDSPELCVLGKNPFRLPSHSTLVYQWHGAQFRGKGRG